MAEPPRALLRVRADERRDPPRPRAFLHLRSITTTIEAEGFVSAEGTWDFVERPAGLDAVVVLAHRDEGRGREVLLRSGLRIPAALGRPGAPRGPGLHPACFVEEPVAGLAEPGEEGEAALRARARLELEEEAGLRVRPEAITRLGGPLWESPGVIATILHFFAADATGAELVPARGDGSPFETLSSIAWYPLDAAIARLAHGDGPGDLRAELGVRRLIELISGPSA